VDINRLGDPPRVGFAVVGVLAARYGFSVSVDTRSPYGGVRAVVFLPSVLLTRLDRPQAVRPAPAVEPPAADRPVPGKAAAEPMAVDTVAVAADPAIAADPAAAVAGAPSPAAGTAHEPSLTAGGLPRRRRVTAAVRPPAEADGHGTGPQSPPDERPPAAGRSDAAAPPAGTPARPARQVAAGMGAWQRGTRSGRASGPPESEGRPRA
jgi:hypothetical protein